MVGVSLKLFGVTIPNNSLMDIDDILYCAPLNGYREHPTNDNPVLHDQALLCVTDLEDCCNAPHTVCGDWYYPDGNAVPMNSPYWVTTFRQNRGPNEFVNGRQFYGSVRLFRQWSGPRERGRSTVSYRVLLILMVPSSSMQTLVSLIKTINASYIIVLSIIPMIMLNSYNEFWSLP